MQYRIERVGEQEYPLFDDMLFWRENGFERSPAVSSVSEEVLSELQNPNLYLCAARAEGRYVGWISMVYIPKVSRWKHGHIYVDELWVASEFRRQGIAKALLAEADELQRKLNAVGIRLYVNVQNEAARELYKACGSADSGQAFFMEK